MISAERGPSSLVITINDGAALSRLSAVVKKVSESKAKGNTERPFATALYYCLHSMECGATRVEMDYT